MALNRVLSMESGHEAPFRAIMEPFKESYGRFRIDMLRQRESCG